MVLADAGFELAGETTHTGCDNTPSVAWQTKGSTTTAGAAATLLQEAALHQREHGYLPAIDYLQGVKHNMADDASRKWELSDEEFLTYFNRTNPQERSWQALPLKPDRLSSMTSHLLRLKPNKGSPPSAAEPQSNIGESGRNFVASSQSTPGSPDASTQYQSYRHEDL